MSYSFNVRGANRHEIDRLAGEKFAEIVANQPVHDIDRNQVRTAVHGFTKMLGTPPEGMELSVAVAGWLGYTVDEAGVTRLYASSVSVSAALVTKGA